MVVWLLLAALVMAIAVMEYADLVASRSGRAGNADPRLLVPVPLGELGAIEVADAGTLHRFERDAAGAWFYHGVHADSERAHAHTADPVVAQRIEQALLAFTRTRIERVLASGKEAQAYGVTTPRIIVLAYRAGEKHPLVQYAVGDVAPDTVSRYVEVLGGPGVVTIPGYQIENLTRLIQAVRSPQTSAPR